ncbi:MAG: type 1 glutamine amidotransferase, partial [Actinobacteria bacterium]|nr:type 1 glutamine amidotransferase [Actinomycetota bacterium]
MGSRKVLVIQHDADDGLKQFAKPLLLAGLRIETWNVERSAAPPTLDGYDGLIVLGSLASLRTPAASPWITPERELLQSALSAQLPTLGICFGAQHLAQAGGGAVVPADIHELGWQEISLEDHARNDVLLKRFPSNFPAFQWHYDCIQLPAEAE